MQLEEAIIGAGLTLGVYMSSETTEDSETNLFIKAVWWGSPIPR